MTNGIVSTVLGWAQLRYGMTLIWLYLRWNLAWRTSHWESFKSSFSMLYFGFNSVQL